MDVEVNQASLQVRCKQCVVAARIDPPPTLAIIVGGGDGTRPVVLYNAGRKSRSLRGTRPSSPGSSTDAVLVVPETPPGQVPAGEDPDRWRAVSAGPNFTRRVWEPLMKQTIIECSQGHRHQITPRQILRLARKHTSREATI